MFSLTAASDRYLVLLQYPAVKVDLGDAQLAVHVPFVNDLMAEPDQGRLHVSFIMTSDLITTNPAIKTCA